MPHPVLQDDDFIPFIFPVFEFCSDHARPFLTVLTDFIDPYASFLNAVHEPYQFGIYFPVSGLVEAAFKNAVLHPDSVVLQLFRDFTPELVARDVVADEVHCFFPSITFLSYGASTVTIWLLKGIASNRPFS